MNKIGELFGSKAFGTRVVPVALKIMLIFFIFILVSGLTSNYINLYYNRAELHSLMRQLLVKDLRDINTFCNRQHEIFTFNHNLKASIKSIREKALFELKNDKAAALGVRPDGTLFFQATKIKKRFERFEDPGALEKMKKKIEEGIDEGYMPIVFNNTSYFAVYKYNKNWDMFIVRAEEKNDFERRQNLIFLKISAIIILITLVSAAVGIYLIRHILRFIGVITKNIMRMVEEQNLQVIDFKKAPNDDITYLGMAFNSLSSTIDNLIGIFRKFANQDVVAKAYREREVRLEGNQQNLTILFSDIKSFTLITETLGTDIIKLLNLHYDRAIREVHAHDGVIGAIIGDALLAVFGALDKKDDDDEPGPSKNKSLQAVLAAYKIQDVARSLRNEMRLKKEEAVKLHGSLLPADLKVFRAVMLEIGVGIDGGEVFYGTIGSYVRMTNTVIGDNVNAASRLEGLTRVYRMPVICSEYVKSDIEQDMPNCPIRFVELDTVQVKGKTEGIKIYLPAPVERWTERVERETVQFSQGLRLYYQGDWPGAYEHFHGLRLKCAREFRKRTRNAEAPRDWNGIWEMKTK